MNIIRKLISILLANICPLFSITVATNGGLDDLTHLAPQAGDACVPIMLEGKSHLSCSPSPECLKNYFALLYMCVLYMYMHLV